MIHATFLTKWLCVQSKVRKLQLTVTNLSLNALFSIFSDSLNNTQLNLSTIFISDSFLASGGYFFRIYSSWTKVSLYFFIVQNYIFWSLGLIKVSFFKNRVPLKPMVEARAWTVLHHYTVWYFLSLVDSLLLQDLPQDFVVVMLFYVHGKHLRSCRDGQLT